MRAARAVAVPAALALALAACTGLNQSAAPRSESTSAECRRLVPTSRQVRGAVEELRSFLQQVGEEIRAQVERLTPRIDLEDLPTPDVTALASDLVVTFEEAELEEARGEIRAALREAADLIRAKLSEAVARFAQDRPVPEPFQRVAECL